MLPVETSELHLIFDVLFKLDRLAEFPIPYSYLKVATRHRFGVLRAWPKAKSFWHAWPETWAAVKFRPLASYAQHYWKMLLSHAGKLYTAMMRHLRIGFGTEQPRRITEAAGRFNGDIRPGTLHHPLESRELDVGTYDITEFFPNVEPRELMMAIDAVLRLHYSRTPELVWF